MLLVSLEPEEEAGAIFLRLRKANRKRDLPSWTLAPYLSDGAHKIGATLIPTLPGEEAAVLDGLGLTGSGQVETGSTPALDADSVILVGERAAELVRRSERLLAAAGTYRRPAGLGASTRGRPRSRGCRLPAQSAARRPSASPTRRPGSTPRPPGESASLPTLEGRDADEMLISAADAELRRWWSPESSRATSSIPQAALEGLEKIGFVISIETRASPDHGAGGRRAAGLA